MLDALGLNAGVWNTKAMPQKQLILHVGFHKSGTTALQESFFVQRDELLAQGIEYPNTGKKAHHRAVWALASKRWGWKDKGGETTPYRTWLKMLKLVNSSKAQSVVLSSEFFSELSSEKIRKIQQEIKGRQVKVLFTLRPLAKLLGSSYQQYLKYGLKEDYSTWLHSVLDEPGVSKLNPTFWQRHMHAQVISNWAEVFGANNVSVIMVDEQKPELLFEAINSYLDLPAGYLKSQPTGSNRSLSMEELTLLLEINRQFPKSRSWSEYLAFVRKGYVRQLTNVVPIKEGKPKLATPGWAIDKANQIASGSKQTILGLGVSVIGDISVLDKAEVLKGEPSYPDSIDIETVAKAMLVFDRHSLNWFPRSWLVSVLIGKIKKAVLFFRK